MMFPEQIDNTTLQNFFEGEDDDIWMMPDLDFQTEELLPVDPLTDDMLPEALIPFINDVAYRMQCPKEFVATALIVVLGSIIGASCTIRPKDLDDWQVIPNIWGAVVAPPGSKKSPATSKVIGMLTKLEIEAHTEYAEAINQFEAQKIAHDSQRKAIQEKMKQEAKKGKHSEIEKLTQEMSSIEAPQKPKARRYMTNDSTVEKLSDIMSENPRGVLVFRDELIGLFKTFQRSGHEGDRAFYLTGWNGSGANITDRIGRGTILTKNVCLSLLGAIQPSKVVPYLSSAMTGRDNDGLMQRLQCLVYPDPIPKFENVNQPPDTRASDRVFKIIKTLNETDYSSLASVSVQKDKVKLERPWFVLDAKAQSLFDEWYIDWNNEKLRCENTHPVLLEHLAKYDKLVPALALIFHLVHLVDPDEASWTGPVSANAMMMSLKWAKFLESHARRVYGMAASESQLAASVLAEKIQKGIFPENGSQTFTVRELYRKNWSKLPSKAICEAACDELVAAHWLKKRWVPPSFQFMVNPHFLKNTNSEN